MNLTPLINYFRSYPLRDFQEPSVAVEIIVLRATALLLGYGLTGFRLLSAIQLLRVRSFSTSSELHLALI